MEEERYDGSTFYKQRYFKKQSIRQSNCFSSFEVIIYLKSALQYIVINKTVFFFKRLLNYSRSSNFHDWPFIFKCPLLVCKNFSLSCVTFITHTKKYILSTYCILQFQLNFRQFIWLIPGTGGRKESSNLKEKKKSYGY